MPDRPRILIITYYWPPLNLIASHRPYWFASHFSSRGASVTVLTSRKHDLDGPTDLRLPALPGVRVIESTSLTAWGRGVAALRRSPLWGGLRGLHRATGRVVGNAVRPRPDESWLSNSRPLVATLAERHDIVISSYGPAAAHVLASEVKAGRPDLHWIADYRDYWSLAEGQGLTEEHRREHAERERRIVGGGADVIASVSPEYCEKLSSFLELPALLVSNGFDTPLEVVAGQIAAYRARPVSDPFRIVYTGTLYPEFQDPRPVIEALARLDARGQLGTQSVTVDFYGAAVTDAASLAQDPAVGRFVRLMGYVPRAAAVHAQTRADLLLLIGGDRPGDAGVPTGKLFEYMAAGVPILAVGCGPGSVVARLLATTRCGRVAGRSVEAIEAILLDALSGRLRSAFAPDLAEVGQYHRLAQAELLWQHCVSIARTTLLGGTRQ